MSEQAVLDTDYRLLSGEVVDLTGLDVEDLAFLLSLQRRATDGEDYFALDALVCGPGAPALKGATKVTSKVARSPLFRVAQDILQREGIRRGIYAAPAAGEPDPSESLMSVTEAARELGITRAAVLKAANAGSLRGRKVGNTWVLLGRSVRSYRVAPHRVAAGKAAHRDHAE